MENRTDLAFESYENQGKSALCGVKVTEKNGISVVQVLNSQGEKAIGKPVGKYITCKVSSFVSDTDIFDGRLEKVSALLEGLMPQGNGCVLVAGVGNTCITADALGPVTNKYVLATRHITEELRRSSGFENLRSVATISTGVLGETGIETAEIIKGVVAQIHPDCVIVVDALASSSPRRLGTTVQLSDTGISPGSGVGNHRHEISQRVLGVPVVSVGIPTVVSTRNLDSGTGEEMYVTPREIDRITEQGAKFIGMAINVCLQKGMNPKELYALVG